jgi:UDP-N-acetylglucosamine 2-epimerase (non-hydrolysing)
MIAVILGTRPEIIKMAPVIRACEKKGADYFVLHTGQHYDYEMDKVFFKELELKPESVNLDVGSGSHGEVTGKMLMGIERALMERNPETVLVQGDTNTVVAGSLAAVKLHKSIGHVEAGLRSYDREQPEEYNRIIADHISSHLFAPTERAEKILLDEGLPRERIFLTGNTIVDAVLQNLEIARKRSDILTNFNLQKDGYFLVTAHREEIVDYRDRFTAVLEGLKKVSEKYGLPMIFPMHPRTRKRIRELGLDSHVKAIKNLKITQPLGFLDFLMLEANARLVLSDSGGVVEEACILRVPCVSMRNRTDRQESIDAGASLLSGTDREMILKSAEEMLARKRNWKNPFGDGKAGEKIVQIVGE